MKNSGLRSGLDQFNQRKTETSQNQSIQQDNNFGETQQTVQSYQQQTMSFSDRNMIKMDNVKFLICIYIKTKQERFQMSNNYNQLFKEINGQMEEIKKSAEHIYIQYCIISNLKDYLYKKQSNEEILKDMSTQSEKLGSAISFLRQFMFMNNIHFDNQKFLNEQQQQSEYDSSQQNISKTQTVKGQQITNKSQQKNSQPNAYFQNKSKVQQVNNTSATNLTTQKRDKSPITVNQQSQVSQQQSQQQSSQQSQGNQPSKLSGMLNSILQERKSKTNNSNTKSGVISTKKIF